MSLSEPPCLGKPGVLLGAGSRTLGLGGLAGLVFCSSASPHPPVLCVWPSSSRVKAWVSVPLALFSGLQCWALCGGVLRGIVQVKPTLRLKAKPSRMGHLGSPLGVVVSIPCAVCPQHLAVCNEAGQLASGTADFQGIICITHFNAF